MNTPTSPATMTSSSSTSNYSNLNTNNNPYDDSTMMINNHTSRMLLQQQQPPQFQHSKQFVIPNIEMDNNLPPPKFKSVRVTNNPILIHNGGGFLNSKHYWSFEVVSEINRLDYSGTVPSAFLNGQQVVSVRRRFRHFCALEERLRQSAKCAGSILPPRPHKHSFDEAGQNQTEEFARRRAEELDEYMTLLSRHPKAGHSEELTLFLTLGDDIGTAWPDVSSNALTRLTEGTTNLVKTITGEGNMDGDDMYHGESAAEDDATLLALSCQESLRIGVVSQAVPKLEGAVVLLKEHSEKSGNVGMEINRVIVNANSATRSMHRQLKLGPTEHMEIFSNAMIKSGRRSKRMSTDAAVFLKPFLYQLRICQNIRCGFSDRRRALSRKMELRDIADEKAHRLLSLQYQINSTGGSGPGNTMNGVMGNNPYSNDAYANSYANLHAEVERMEVEAAVGDEEATSAATKALETGAFLKQEVARLSLMRKTEWMTSMKALAVSMRESADERKNIWETALATVNSFD